MSQCCVICGVDIIPDFIGTPWASKYRAVYSAEDEARLSGVGLRTKHNVDEFIVPVKETDRWDDLECRLTSIRVPHRRSYSGVYPGFVFHEACWALLEECFLGKSVPLDQFLDVLHSLAFTHGWKGRQSLLSDYHGSPAHKNRYSDPYHVPQIQEILELPSTFPPSAEHIASKKLQGHQTCNQDCFLRLPAEMIEMIAAFLSTKDVFSLRYASRVFTPLFYSQGFWSTRFKVNGDRGFLFDIWNDRKRKVRDWRALYRWTHNTHSFTALINRKRVWVLCQSLMEKLLLEWSDWQSSQPMPKISPGCRWEKIGGKLDNKSRLCYYEQKAPILSLPSKVGVSIVHDGLDNYISGIHLISEDGTEIRLGYASSERVCTEVSGVRGFIPATGQKGIHAIQVVDLDGFISPWLGYPNEGPQTMRFVFKGPISGLETMFDGYKMVRLAALGRKKDIREQNPQYNRATGGRLRSLNPSETDLSKNEIRRIDSPKKMKYVESKMNFGGPGGAYLRYLVRISAIYKHGSLNGIEFYYNHVDIWSGCHKFGQCVHTPSTRTIDFDIDGPGGEVIKYIDVPLHGEPFDNRYRALCDFKIWTNRGRSCFFQEHNNNKPLVLSPGSFRRIDDEPKTPVGFYARQCDLDHSSEKSMRFGVISIKTQ